MNTKYVTDCNLEYINNELELEENFLVYALKRYQNEEKEWIFIRTTCVYGAMKTEENGEIFIGIRSELGGMRFSVEEIASNFSIYGRFGNEFVAPDRDEVAFKGHDGIYDRIGGDDRQGVYYCGDNNNMLIFSAESEKDEIADIVNATHSGYDHLVKTLNSTNGVIVYWTKAESTTSDYVIYYDFDPREFVDKGYREIIKTLREVEYEHRYMKYVEVKEGKSAPIPKKDGVRD